MYICVYIIYNIYIIYIYNIYIYNIYIYKLCHLCRFKIVTKLNKHKLYFLDKKFYSIKKCIIYLMNWKFFVVRILAMETVFGEK